MSIPQVMKAVFFDGEKASVKENVPVPKLESPTDILIKVKAVAGNPTDWKHVEFKLGGINCLVGCDVAGDIVEVGSEVDPSKFKVGDHVASIIHGCAALHPDNGAFAEYTRASSFFAVKIDKCTTSTEPSIKAGLPITNYESAAALPVSLYTAVMVSAWNFKNKVEFDASIRSGKPQNDFPLLIWGGATGFGQYLIQIAKLTNAYSKIIVVASKKHESLLKSFGADEIFDYHDADVIEQITSKYPNLTHLVDGVSNETTFNQTYQLASKTEKSIVVNLMHYGQDKIKEEYTNSKVELGQFLLYCISNEDIPFGGFSVPKMPEFAQLSRETIPKLQVPINNGELKTIAIKNHKGLEVIPEILEAIKTGKNSGEKYTSTI